VDRTLVFSVLRWTRGSPKLSFGIGAFLLCAVLNLLLPPDLSRVRDVSRTVVAANDAPLRTYLTRDSMIRHGVTLEQISPRYVDLLIAYEDQRFYRHSGVDGLALARAALQAARGGRIVSGGSTFTMQVARLLEPRRRSIAAKLIEMLRAWQLEMRFTKPEILQLYLTLAPMGGNIEGIEAASRLYFNKPAASLSLADAATLVALPQSPTRLRKAPTALRFARNKILGVAAPRAGYERADIKAAISAPVAFQLRRVSFSAPQLSDRMLLSAPDRITITTTLNQRWQQTLERNAPRWRQGLDRQASLAILVCDIRTRAVRAYVATADFSSVDRDGQVDMVTAVRSPGSAVKPFLYARAFDQGIAHPLTLVDDVETRFGSYTPTNFQEQYHGRVTLSDALRLSLNVPAVLLMDRIGPVAFTEQMRRDGLTLQLPKGVRPGLPVALGGVGVTLENLVAGYAALADDGVIRPLVYAPADRARINADAFAGRGARAAVATILRTTAPPDGVANRSSAVRAIALKTGTSYGYRDAWAFGFDGRHVVGVWTGRPDGTPSPGRFGVNTAAPIFYDVFDLIGIAPPSRAGPESSPVPAALKVLNPGATGAAQRALKIAFPVDGAIMPYIAGKSMPLEARGGKAPYIWIANGTLVGEVGPGQSLMWQPDGPGFHTLTLVDATGRASTAKIRISETVGFVP
jgi:penicillin-binding protein 1C